MLGEPESANCAPGPGTLRAVVQRNKEHHPHVYIEDCATGSSRLLLDKWTSRPKWSPDGKWIACDIYGSPQRPYNLGLVEMTSGRLWRPELGGQLEEYKWSPDSRWLALELADPMGGFTVLGFFSLAAGSFQPVDTLTLFASYDVAWSPDSRTLAVSKPTYTDRDNEDEVTQSDVWLMSLSKARCRLVEGRGFLAAAPRWIDSTHVRFVRDVWKIDASGSSDSIVVEIAPRR
jgi:Tol biopolymer transport system component